MHLGLIGGIGPAATVFYYSRIVAAFAEAGQPLHLTIVHTSAADLSRNVSNGYADEQADEFLRVTKQLAAAGADAVAITSMGGHFCIKEFAPLSPLPILYGPQAVATHLEQRGITRVGVIGTRIVMETGLYGALAELEPLAPSGADLMQANDDYLAVAMAGVANNEQTERLLNAGRKLVAEQGAEAVLLGGTDLNLVYDGVALDFVVVDSAAVHVDSIVAAALA